MKYIKTIFLMLMTGLSLQAQSSLKGILQTDFSEIGQEKSYTNSVKKWGLKDVPQFENNDCNRTGGLDIAFLVDATSSMNDQIEFLKIEMNNMILEVQKNQDIQFRTSAVFYRDKEEEYQVISSNFETNLNKTIQFIDKQRAAGGGDYPEDFALGFTKAVQMDWDVNADAKLLSYFVMRLLMQTLNRLQPFNPLMRSPQKKESLFSLSLEQRQISILSHHENTSRQK